jgi:predicted enzyme related to lactoylglutathione lyase
MKSAHVLGMATLWIAAMNAGCGNSNAPGIAPMPGTAGAGSRTTGVTGTPSAGAGSAAVSVTAGASGSPSGMTSMTGTTAGTSAPLIAGNTAGSTAGSAGSAAGKGGSVAVSAGSSAATGGTGAANGGAAGTVGAAGAAGGPTGLDIPAPMKAPLVWGFGVGITDVPAAVKFYTGVMKMTVEQDAVKRDDKTETTLYGTQAMRGARLVLMKFDDMRNTRKITAKLVWQAQNTAAVNTAASMYPDYVSRLNIGIVQFDGPETYIHEVGGSFDSGGTAISVPYPVAVGFAVSDQPASRKFYTSLGMTEMSLGSFSVTDANGTGNIAEYTVKFADGMGVVLQQWTPMRNAKDNPVKVVLFVPDAKAMADKVVAAGGTIAKPAERTPVYGNRLLVVAKDLDGYVLDIVE